MSIEKCLDFTNGYNRKSDEPNPTTRGDMIRFVGNQNNVLMNLADGLWQPGRLIKRVPSSVPRPFPPDTSQDVRQPGQPVRRNRHGLLVR